MQRRSFISGVLAALCAPLGSFSRRSPEKAMREWPGKVVGMSGQRNDDGQWLVTATWSSGLQQSCNVPEDIALFRKLASFVGEPLRTADFASLCRAAIGENADPTLVRFYFDTEERHG